MGKRRDSTTSWCPSKTCCGDENGGLFGPSFRGSDHEAKQPEIRTVKVNVHPDAHLGISVFEACRKAAQMPAVKFDAALFARGTVEAIHDVHDSDILMEWHDVWANNFRESTKVHLGEIGAQIGKVEI